ncbi:MAG: phosphatidylglycerophosphatase A [Gammaproteobacteria bacterium]|nr:phosphatidylglycerophosphatase A [Gammaproteobacteria bacterium]MBQ0841110.1 phosphatidylglycerophosphatase A [Gammaproteobacteria bacterium]
MTALLKPTFSSLRKDPILLLGLGFGSGLSPFAPGTAGTVLALLFVPLLALLSTGYLLAVLLVASLAGIYICGYAAHKLGAKDPSSIVWDEFVGLWIALAGFPVSSFWLISGFVVFRCFDILKPWPISVLDRRVPGGLGIMLDDILAGVMTWLVLRLMASVFGLSV